MNIQESYQLPFPIVQVYSGWASSNGDGEVTEIDLNFSEIDGGTQIDLTHGKFQKQESADQHSSDLDGFDAFLGR